MRLALYGCDRGGTVKDVLLCLVIVSNTHGLKFELCMCRTCQLKYIYIFFILFYHYVSVIRNVKLNRIEAELLPFYLNAVIKNAGPNIIVSVITD